MARGRDQAGNIWELDASGKPVSLIQAAPRTPGSIGGGTFIPAPPNFKTQEEQRAERADVRAQHADQRAAQANAREQAKFESEDTMAPPPGDTSKTGEDYLATIPPSLAGQVRALMDGRRAMPTGTALRSPAVQQLIAAATQADPTLDAANSATRVATRKDFTSGKSAQNVTALNTVIGHLGSLWSSAQDLHNRGLVPWNALANATESTFGDPRLNNYNLARKAVADELERVFRQTGGNVSEIQEWKNSLSSSSSPEQFRGAMSKAMELLNSRLDALGAQYNQGMSRSDQPISLLKPHAQGVFQALQEGGSGILPGSGPSAPPPALGGGTPPRPPGRLGGAPRADYSSMTGQQGQDLATGGYRNAPDPAMAAAMSAFIRKGTPYETVAAFQQSHGFTPSDPKSYAAAVAYQQQHPSAVPNVEADRTLPTTMGERLAASPAAAAFTGAVSGGTAGISDAIGRGIAGPQWDANRAALAALNPKADILGNVAGGVVGSLAVPSLIDRVAPGALSKASTALGKFAAPVSDAAYGGIYGTNENPDDPVMGGLMGAVAGAGGGIVGRKAVGGLSSVIAPPAGGFRPIYETGNFPTPGQRFSRSGLAGRMVNGVEQAMQSVPVWGAAPAAARQATRDGFQVGAFNKSLSELAPFQQLGHDVPNSLPSGIGPGTQAHAITSDAFDKAYDTARSGMQFVPDQQYLTEAQALGKKVQSGVLSPDQAQQVGNVVNNAVVGRLKAQGGVLNGDAYKAASSDLGQAIQTWGKNPTTAPMADALSDYASIFDDAARRASDPQAVNLLDAADKGYAQLVRIQRASEMGGAAKDAGTFTPVNYAGAVKQMGGGVRSNAFNRGLALGQDYADAGLNLRDTLADSGTPTRLAVIGGLQGAEGAGLAATHGLSMLASPKLAGAFAPYLPGVRQVTNRLIAPREFTLPPALSNPLNAAGAQLDNLAPLIGKAAVPVSLAYFGYAQ